MSVGAAFLVKDPPLDRLAMLVDYLRPLVSQFVFAMDDRTSWQTRKTIQSWPNTTVIGIEWHDDFAEARNSVLDLLETDWTLIVDPDELPSIEMMSWIASIDRDEKDPAAVGWQFWTVNYWAGLRGPEEEYHWHIRLWRTGRGRFYRKVHELVLLDGRPETDTRNLTVCPKAPKSAYLIHSKDDREIEKAEELYGRLGEISK